MPTRDTGACRGTRSWRRPSSWRATASRRRPAIAHEIGRGRAASLTAALGGGAGLLRGCTARTAGRRARVSSSGCRPSPRRSRPSPRTGSTRSTRADRGASGARARRRRVGDRRRATSRRHTSTWGEPIAIDYRGVRVTTHPPNSSGIVALELLSILARSDPPPRSAFGPYGVTDPAWVHRGIEAAKLAMADRDLHLTDPECVRGAGRALARSGARGVAGGTHRPGAAPPSLPRRPSRPVAARSSSASSTARATRSASSNRTGPTSAPGSSDPETGVVYHNRGNAFSLDPDHANVLAPGKRTLHTLLPGMLFRAGQPGPWIVAGSMGGDAQPQIHAQFVSAVVDGGVDVATAVAAPRWFVGPAVRFAPPTEVLLEPRHEPGVAEAPGRPRPPADPRPPVRQRPRRGARDRARRRRTGRAGRLPGGRHRPAQRGPAGRLVRGRRGQALCDTRASSRRPAGPERSQR